MRPFLLTGSTPPVGFSSRKWGERILAGQVQFIRARASKEEVLEWAVVPKEDMHCERGMRLRCVQHIHESPVYCKPLRLL